MNIIIASNRHCISQAVRHVSCSSADSSFTSHASLLVSELPRRHSTARRHSLTDPPKALREFEQGLKLQLTSVDAPFRMVEILLPGLRIHAGTRYVYRLADD